MIGLRNAATNRKTIILVFIQKQRKNMKPMKVVGGLVYIFQRRKKIILIVIHIRSSRPEVFCKNSVLWNFAKFAGKHLCQSLFLLWYWCFPVNFAKFLRTAFLQNASERCFCHMASRNNISSFLFMVFFMWRVRCRVSNDKYSPVTFSLVIIQSFYITIK